MSVAVIFTLSLSGCIVKTKEAKENTVLAKVGDNKILVSDVNKALKSNIATLKQQYGNDYLENEDAKSQLQQYYESAVDQLVEQKLLYLEAKKKKLVPDLNNIDAEVQKEMDMTKEENFNNNDKQFETGLKNYGYTLKSYKALLKKEMKKSVESFAANRVVYELDKNITVTDDEIKQYYTTNVSKYTNKPGATLYHILVKTKKQAQEIKDRIDKGEKFADLAKKYGTDGTKDKGGELGYYAYDTTELDSDFMAAAKKLKEGEVSGPVHTQFGWHIIKATGVNKKSKVKKLSDVKEEVKSTVLSNKKTEAKNNEITKLKKQYKVKTYKNRISKNMI